MVSAGALAAGASPSAGAEVLSAAPQAARAKTSRMERVNKIALVVFIFLLWGNGRYVVDQGS
jgi:hypothetical protein